MSEQNKEREAFAREDRFIVIKRKDLEAILDSGDPERFCAVLDLRHALKTLSSGLPEREFLVIESDWPEYEFAWGMIEARITGQPSELERLRAENAELRDSLKHWMKTGTLAGMERDELRAKVEAYEKQEPVAWAHDTPGRVDVIHSSVKNLLQASREASVGHLHRPLDKVEHYTIPLYAQPAPARIVMPAFANEIINATPAPAEQLWAVHAQGPDDLYAAFSREDAERHADELNAIPCPPGINVSAVVIESPWSAAEHWKYLAEQEREHLDARLARSASDDDLPGMWDRSDLSGGATDCVLEPVARFTPISQGEHIPHMNPCADGAWMKVQQHESIVSKMRGAMQAAQQEGDRDD